MNASAGLFRALFAVGVALLVLTLGLFALQEPGTEGYVVTVLSLVTQVVMVALGAAGLYFGWDPLAAVVEE